LFHCINNIERALHACFITDERKIAHCSIQAIITNGGPESKMFILSRAKSWSIIFLLCALVGAAGYWLGDDLSSTFTMATDSEKMREVRMVTGEFKSGELEVYRWDPGTVVVHKGEMVALKIYGVNGKSHPFEIRGMGIKGEVVKGKETVVHFPATSPGIYEIVCSTHPEMIGYIVVMDH
jgi:plastocyanin